MVAEKREGAAQVLKPGQTIRIDGRWATLTYLVSERSAIVTFDDDHQELVPRLWLQVPQLVA